MYRSSNFFNLKNKSSSLERQLNIAKNDKNQIESTLRQKQSYAQQIKHALEDAQYRLSEYCRKCSEETEKANEQRGIRDKKKDQQRTYETKAKNIINNICVIDKQIDELTRILNLPKPTPEYAYFCHNNVPNCPNHPLERTPRLVNGDEIKLYEERYHSTLAARDELFKKRSESDDNYRYLKQMISQVVSEIEQAEIILENCKNKIKCLKDSIVQEQRIIEIKQQEYDAILEEVRKYSYELKEADAVIADIQKELFQLQQEIVGEQPYLKNTTTLNSNYSNSDRLSDALRQKNFMMGQLQQARNEAEKDSLYDSIARQELLIEQLQQMNTSDRREEQSFHENDDNQGSSILGHLFTEITDEANKVKTAAGNIRTRVSNTLTTAEDLLQGGIGTITGVIFNAAEDVAGVPIGSSDNFIVENDAANRRTRKGY